MAREYMTSKQMQDYRELCRERDQGRILTPDGLIFICEACHYDNVVKRMAGEAVRWDNLRKRIDEVIDQM